VLPWLVALALLLASCADGEIPITPRALPSPTPTEDLPPTRTPRPIPTATHTPAPVALFVGNTQGQGAVLRSAPAEGTRVAGLGEGARVVPQGEELDVAGNRWLRVVDGSGRAGWIAGQFLVTPRPGSPTPATAIPRAVPSPRR
jgi:hypothetical protein